MPDDDDTETTPEPQPPGQRFELIFTAEAEVTKASEATNKETP